MTISEPYDIIYIVRRYIVLRYIASQYIKGRQAMGITNTSALTETAYYILLSLQKQSHGYAIMQNISSITNGRIKMGAGTLYGALSALNGKKLIRECESDDPARREYIITEEGKAVLKKEIERLEELLTNAKAYFTEE